MRLMQTVIMFYFKNQTFSHFTYSYLYSISKYKLWRLRAIEMRFLFSFFFQLEKARKLLDSEFRSRHLSFYVVHISFIQRVLEHKNTNLNVELEDQRKIK